MQTGQLSLLFKDSAVPLSLLFKAFLRRGSEATTDLHADRAVVLGGLFPAGVVVPHDQCQAEPTLIAVEEILSTADPARGTHG